MNEKWDDKTTEIGYVAHKKLDVQSRRRWVNNSNFKTVFKEFSFMNKYGKCYDVGKDWGNNGRNS